MLKRIGFDARLTFYRQGGIAEYMRQTLNGLASIGDSSLAFYVLHNFRATQSLPPGKRINCYTPCHHRLEGWALGMELLPHRLDLLHSADFIPPRFGAKKYIITVHDLAFLLFPNIQTPDSLRYYAGQIRRAVRQADHIIAVSAATKADLMNLLDVPDQKISVVPEGVHPQFRPTPPPSDLPRDYILFVGTLEPRKNLVKLLEAYALLHERPPLVLVGQKGWLAEPIFHKIAELKLGDALIWKENAAFAALPALYSGARVHVLPSLYEGFGFPPLEAMACGTPTVVSDRGALREVVGENGVYADPDSAESIAAALEKLLTDDALHADLRARGLAHVQRFTWAASAAQTHAIYQAVLAQP